MARQEQDREDLLHEATALAPRGEFQVNRASCTVVIGFRREAASFFFDADPVYHFNAQCELRRAYVDGLLLKADSGRLIHLERQCVHGAVHLLGRALAEPEQTALLNDLAARLQQLNEDFTRGNYRLLRQAPWDGRIERRAQSWLNQVSGSPATVASVPNIDPNQAAT